MMYNFFEEILIMSEIELPHNHGEKNLNEIQKELSKDEDFDVIADIFKQLSDSTRLKIFWILCHSEQCVINIAALLNMSSPAVSHHLRFLHSSGLITSKRNGKEVYYKVALNKQSELLHKTIENMMQITCPSNK